MTDEGEEPRTTNQEPRPPRRRVFVSGCFDLLHAGHLEFFQQARALGDHLTVSFASAEVLRHHKGRAPALPDGHKRALIEGFACVDAVVVGRGEKLGLDFEEDFLRLGPDILAVTTDDRYGDLKRELCARTGCRYVVLEKTPPRVDPVSSSGLVQVIRAPAEAPLRVDFAGGWLDVPRFARPGTFIVNCAISPCVGLDAWPYERKAGLGGSGAWALLRGEDGVGAELDLGVGWQDPAIIRETGLCVWRSGALPVLDFKRNGDLLAGRLALHYTGRAHDTPGAADLGRDYDAIAAAGGKARRAVLGADRNLLAEATDASYQIQLAEGMDPLPGADGALARKYCGGGWGGYALYLFEDPAQRDAFAADPKNQARTVEPFTR